MGSVQNNKDLQVLGVIGIVLLFAPVIVGLIYLSPMLADGHVVLFAVAIGFLSFVLTAAVKLLQAAKIEVSLLGLFFTFIAFTAFIDTFLSLSIAYPGFVLGRFYLEHGEKYFACAYGFMCLFWDGTFHLAIQATIAFLLLSKRDVHFTLLVWGGSIINSMQPLLLGAAIGPYSSSIQLSTALNIPYLVIPPGILLYLINKPTKFQKEGPGSRVNPDSAIADVILLIYNILTPTIHVIRTLCVLNSAIPFVSTWLKLEPVLDQKLMKEIDDKQDFAFNQVQVIQWAFWFVPWHLAAFFEQIARIWSGKRSIILGTYGAEFSAVVFGAYLQSVACYLTAAAFTMPEGQMGIFPRNVHLSNEFWLMNICILVGSGLHFIHFLVQDIVVDHPKNQ